VLRECSAEFAPSVPQVRIARQDGFKIEGLTVREVSGLTEIYAGTDDENYGAVLKRIVPSR
jgi:hypothetical protein